MKRILFALALILLAAGCNRDFKAPQGEDLEHRLSTIFTKSRDEVREYIRQYLPDVSEEQIDQWTREEKLEAMEINGETLYFRRSPANLFLLDSVCNAAKFGAEDNSEEVASEIAEMHSLIDECDSTGRPFGSTEKIHVRHSLTVNADAVPAGKTIRCWLPVPRRDVKRHKEMEITGASEAKYILADIKAPHSSIYLERKAEEGKPTEFWVEYDLTISGEYHDLSCVKSAAYDKSSAQYKRFTAEQAPHIVFTEQMRQLSDSLTRGLRNPVDKAKAIFAWVSDSFPWSGSRDYSTYENIPEYVLRTGHGDCGQVTLLFMTLARIAGIPCRWQSGLIAPRSGWNMHDWCEAYFEGIGWVPVDQSAGIPSFADEHPELTWFYLGGKPTLEIAVNNEWGKPLQPAKRYIRSECVDFQAGEVEWSGGNLYNDSWDWDLEIEYLD